MLYMAQDIPGAKLLRATDKWLRDSISNDLIENLGMEETQAEAMGKKCSSIVANLKDQLKQYLSSPGATAYNSVSNKEMRIAVTAESNSAADNILAYLDSDPVFKAKGYCIIRLGPADSVRFCSSDSYNHIIF